MNAEGGSVRVVIAEDNEMLRETLGLALQEAGYEVVGAAADGVAAVETVLREEPDVTVMDIRMPGIDGIEATRRIREASGSRTIVLMLTAFDEPTLMQSALDAGAAGFLVKGIPLARLVDEIQHAHVLKGGSQTATEASHRRPPASRSV
jgi:two-component system, NarL family, response regulator DesR